MTETLLWLVLLSILILAVLIAIYPLERRNYRSQLISAIFLILGAIIGYSQLGSLTQWGDYLHQQEINKRAQVFMHSLKSSQELIDKLKSQLQQKPNSARGWYLLGRVYASQNQWESAHQAFLKAHQLEPNNAQITVNYAQSLWQINNQIFTKEVRELFQALLKENPNQPDSLSMLAMDAYQQGQYQKAIDYWSTLLHALPQDSSESKVIRKAILKAREMIDTKS